MKQLDGHKVIFSVDLSQPCTPYNRVLYELNLILKLLQVYNFRISEILRLNLCHLLKPDKVIVKLSKCKDYFILRDKTIHDALFSVFTTNQSETWTVSYKRIYAYIKRNSPEFVMSGGKHNQRVTHSFRYKTAKELKEKFNDDRIIKAGLNHQSLSSQKYYLK